MYQARKLVGQAKRRTTKIRRNAVAAGIFDCFSNFDKCRLEVTDDAISSVTVEYVGMDVRATFDEHGLKSGQII